MGNYIFRENRIECEKFFGAGKREALLLLLLLKSDCQKTSLLLCHEICISQFKLHFTFTSCTTCWDELSNYKCIFLMNEDIMSNAYYYLPLPPSPCISHCYTKSNSLWRGQVELHLDINCCHYSVRQSLVLCLTPWRSSWRIMEWHMCWSKSTIRRESLW